MDTHPAATSEHANRIEIEAIKLRNDYLEACETERQEKISSALETVYSFYDVEYPSASRGMEKAFQSLQGITSAQSKKRHLPIVVENVTHIPPYSAWIPVKSKYALHTLDEPYRPYFGDREEEVAASDRAFRMMSEGTYKQATINSSSDEEVSVQPDDEELKDDRIEDVKKYGRKRSPRKTYLHAARIRAASRHALLRTVTRFGLEIPVFEALAKALNFADANEVETNIYRAQRKRNRKMIYKQKLATSQEYTTQIKKAVVYPQTHNHSSSTDLTNFVAIVLHQFCYVCNVFSCDLHSRVRLVPRREITDLALSKRLALLRADKVSECSKRCHFLDRWRQNPLDRNEGKQWTEEEVELLREGLLLFKDDPCRLAIVIGSKSCREVWKRIYIDAKKERKRALHAASAQYDMFFTLNRKVAAKQNVRSDSYVSRVRGARGSRQGRRKKLRTERSSVEKPGSRTMARKTAIYNNFNEEDSNEELEDEAGDITFMPCDHDGPCEHSKECACMQLDRLCQPYCCCNNIRYTEDDGRIVGKGAECSHTQLGCDCTDGMCIDDECRCVKENGVSCSPEECNCDCKTPPWLVGREGRKCKNVGIAIRNHKRTFIGRSHVEGYGLFAGAHFRKGDAVGEYLGGQWSKDKADQLLAIGHVTERTYAYDIMNVCVDGKMFGAKVKFINCSVKKQDQNCHPNLICINGHYHLVLKATRDVKPGEEFFFNYGLHGAKAYTWLKEAKRQARLKLPSSPESD